MQWVTLYGLDVSIFRFLLVRAAGFSLSVLLLLSLLVDVGCKCWNYASCGTDVGDVGVAELEELVDKAGTTIGT